MNEKEAQDGHLKSWLWINKKYAHKSYLIFSKDLAYAMDTNDSGDIDFPEFVQLMSKRIADGNLEEDITEAFKVNDLYDDQCDQMARLFI